ncbi:MAG: hypothetical protein J1F64_06000 [Oscillospiraceae bacterium]|nr:hypothetical protein [Oscillospiraceae bacterium]
MLIMRLKGALIDWGGYTPHLPVRAKGPADILTMLIYESVSRKVDLTKVDCKSQMPHIPAASL